jgi:hypothetical protein
MKTLTDELASALQYISDWLQTNDITGEINLSYMDKSLRDCVNHALSRYESAKEVPTHDTAEMQTTAPLGGES